MYNGIQKIEEVIEYIENNITCDIDCNVLAEKMQLSVYEFRRIFSFVVGCPVYEYIRKRRLSLAAIEIATKDKIDMLELSQKYGYSSQSGFIKAFGEHHKMSPTACMEQKGDINIFTRPKFKVDVYGRENIDFKIKDTKPFYIKGFTAVSSITDSCCCENVWNEFYEKEEDKKLQSDRIYVSYRNEEGNVKCTIGEKADGGQLIPASKWACFKMNTVDDDIVNETYSKILYEYLPSANLLHNYEIPTVEIYPFDMSQDGFSWEIMIPIKEK